MAEARPAAPSRRSWWRAAAAGVACAVALAACGDGNPDRPTAEPAAGAPPSSAPEVAAAATPRVLVMSRTAEYRHGPAIGAARQVLRDEAAGAGFAVDLTEDPGAFTSTNLARYDGVVFLHTTGDVLEAAGQAALEGFVQAGGGFVGIHSASDTEYGWPWYEELVGAWFLQHPAGVHDATVQVEDASHPSMAGLPARWDRTDEWYDFRRNPRTAGVHVLATLDEATYQGGTMGSDHPIAWCQLIDGGRSWYSAGGHDAAAFADDDFVGHVLGGIRWAVGLVEGDCGPPRTSGLLPDVDPGPGPGPGDPDPGSPDPAGPSGPNAPATPGSTAARYVPAEPFRLLDTRLGLSAPQQPVPSDGTIVVDVGGRSGIPVDAVAVALNVTATEATGPGYVTVWPTGQPRPTTSSLNVEAAGQTIAAATAATVGDGGTVSFYVQTATELVADVAGWWLPATTSPDGRLQPVQPSRLLDTRTGEGTTVAGPLAADGELVLDVAGRGGVPAQGATAVVVNLTATEPTGAGFVTAWPAGPRPTVSAINVERPGQTLANLAIVPLDAEGRLRLSAQRPVHLVVDVAGWFTDATAPVASDGLYVPVTPVRVLDTRTGTGSAAAGPLPAGGTVDVDPALALAGGGASAVLATATATEAGAPGYVTAYPAGSPRPLASNLNVAEGQTIANLVVGRLGDGGRTTAFTQEPLHLVVDVVGWFQSATTAG